MIPMGIVLLVFAIASRIAAARQGVSDGITHRPFSSPYQAAPAAREER